MSRAQCVIVIYCLRFLQSLCPHPALIPDLWEETVQHLITFRGEHSAVTYSWLLGSLAQDGTRISDHICDLWYVYRYHFSLGRGVVSLEVSLLPATSQITTPRLNINYK